MHAWMMFGKSGDLLFFHCSVIEMALRAIGLSSYKNSGRVEYTMTEQSNSLFIDWEKSSSQTAKISRTANSKIEPHFFYPY